MKKLALQIDALVVESFDTLELSRSHGTVNARNGEYGESVAEPIGFDTIACHTVNYLPCDSDLCNKTKPNENTCAPIVCINVGLDAGGAP